MPKRKGIEKLETAPHTNRCVIYLDEIGPLSATIYAGMSLIPRFPIRAISDATVRGYFVFWHFDALLTAVLLGVSGFPPLVGASMTRPQYDRSTICGTPARGVQTFFLEPAELTIVGDFPSLVVAAVAGPNDHGRITVRTSTKHI
jgi:hypothetical protein